MSGLVDRITAVLRAHVEDEWGYCAACSDLVDPDAAHVAEQIAATLPGLGEVEQILATVGDEPGAVRCPCVGAGPPAEWCWVGAAPHCRYLMPNRSETKR